MFDHVEIAHLSFLGFFFYGKERPSKTKFMPAKLRAVFAPFGFSKNDHL